ncbi:MAG: hypothetical protein ABJA35_11760 [Parafilimonas sp.]
MAQRIKGYKMKLLKKETEKITTITIIHSSEEFIDKTNDKYRSMHFRSGKPTKVIEFYLSKEDADIFSGEVLGMVHEHIERLVFGKPLFEDISEYEDYRKPTRLN